MTRFPPDYSDDQAPPGPAGVIPVHVAVRGRARFQVPGLYRNEA
jgi:hypothetical protein